MKSATPPERFFGFTHTGDTGWEDHHYCRSWLMLGLHKFGSIVNVDESEPPYENSRRLISTEKSVKDPNHAHSASTPGGASPISKDGKYLYEEVWGYLYTHPVGETGKPVKPVERCRGDFGE